MNYKINKEHSLYLNKIYVVLSTVKYIIKGNYLYLKNPRLRKLEKHKYSGYTYFKFLICELNNTI